MRTYTVAIDRYPDQWWNPHVTWSERGYWTAKCEDPAFKVRRADWAWADYATMVMRLINYQLTRRTP